MLTLEQLKEIRDAQTDKYQYVIALLDEIIHRCELRPEKSPDLPSALMAAPTADTARVGGVPARAETTLQKIDREVKNLVEKHPVDLTRVAAIESGKAQSKRFYSKRRSPCGAGSEVLKDIINTMPQPFSLDDLRTAVKDKTPELLKSKVPSFLSGSLNRFHQQGLLLRSGTKNGMQAYVRSQDWQKPMQTQEEKYREFRSTIPTTAAEV